VKIPHILAAFAVLALLSGPAAISHAATADEYAGDRVPEGDGSNLRPDLPVPGGDAPQKERRLVQPDDLPGSSIPHLTTNDFLSKVGGAELPVLVQFDAQWCPFCKKLQPALDRMRGQKEGALEIYKVDIDHEPDLQRSYEVASLPTLIMFYGGRIVGRSDGSLSEAELQDWVKAVEDDIKKTSRKLGGAAQPL
jgi:thioredoxin